MVLSCYDLWVLIVYRDSWMFLCSCVGVLGWLVL